ncbi:hypothetical protein BDV93DRAFT_563931 [Ceratobasidium sp. AG-I]|nr:hypothetical protein BDV93DRAFT_563931 [Ceratobasidium sp. AG-I]
MAASAALNVPNTNYNTYFFKGDHDSLAYGPAKFADNSIALKNAGSLYIDAILPKGILLSSPD